MHRLPEGNDGSLKKKISGAVDSLIVYIYTFKVASFFISLILVSSVRVLRKRIFLLKYLASLTSVCIKRE